MNTGRLVSSVKLALSPGYFVSAIFTPQNATYMLALASSNNNIDRTMEFFLMDKLRETFPAVTKFPKLVLPDDVEQSPTVTGALQGDALLATVGGHVLMWSIPDITSPPKQLFSITAASPLGMDNIAAVTTDPKLTEPKIAVVWDYILTSTLYMIDIAAHKTIPLDLRKYCGGESNFSVWYHHSFFDAQRQRFYILVDSCAATLEPRLIYIDTSVYPPTTDNLVLRELGPLDQNTSNFQWVFQLN